MSKFEIEIVNYLDKKGVVAEIYYEAIQWAEICRKKDRISIRFFPHPHKEYWEFSCEEAIKIMEGAKTKFLIRNKRGSLIGKISNPDPEQINKQADKVLQKILNHPEKK